MEIGLLCFWPPVFGGLRVNVRWSA